MSDSIAADWASFAEATAEANRLNKTMIFDALLKAGITHVCIAFDGEGDEGQMERATAQANGNAVEFPAGTLSLWETEFGRLELSTCELSLQEAVEHLCYRCLGDRHPGWEINEGSFGEFTFDVAAREIELDYYGRIVDTEHSSHTF
jgi:hypothetical protein